jgi:hypothetical protein
MTSKAEELFDVVDEHGKPTGKGSHKRNRW